MSEELEINLRTDKYQTNDWHYKGGYGENIMVGFNIKTNEIIAVKSNPDPMVFSLVHRIPKELIDLNVRTSKFFKYALRFYLSEIKGEPSKDIRNMISSQILHTLDAICVMIIEERDKLEEEENIQEKTIEDDDLLIELADKIMQEDLIVPFALSVFGKELVNEAQTAFLVWSSLIGKISIKLGGETCVGKSFISNCVEKALPNSWFLKIGYSDPASLKHMMRVAVQEGRMFKILYLQEEDSKSENEQMNLRLTHSDDGGLKILISKKSSESEYFAEAEEIEIPELTILTTSTHLTFDKQDSSRRMELSPIGTPEQNEAVVGLKFIYKQYPHLKPDLEQEYAILRIIARRISDMDVEVINPFMDKSLVKLSYESSTIRREIDQLINLVDILTMLRQKNRIHINIEERDILISSVNDLLYTLKLGLHTFGIGTGNQNECQKNIIQVVKMLSEEIAQLGDERYRHYVDTQDQVWVPTSYVLSKYLEIFPKKQPATIYENLRALCSDFKLIYKKEGRQKLYLLVDSDSVESTIPSNWDSKIKKQLEDWYKFIDDEIKEKLEFDELEETLLAIDDEEERKERMKTLLQEPIFEREMIKHIALRKILFHKMPPSQTKQSTLSAKKPELSDTERIIRLIRSKNNTACETSDLNTLDIFGLEVKLDTLKTEGIIQYIDGNWRC